MVIVKLQGGIGNQLFQFACGRALAELRGESLFFDLSFLNTEIPNVTTRLFTLAHLDNYKIADLEILNTVNNFFYTGNALVISDDFHKDEILRAATDLNIKALYLDGYFQNQFYFFSYASQIKKEICELVNYHYNLTHAPTIRKLFIQPQSVGIHIRRTDYLNPSALNIHGICEVSYYQQALDIICSRIEHPHFYLFSDDSQFAEELFYLIDQKTNISSMLNSTVLQESDLVELAIMTKCNHFIIANSSYSWWGSYLSEAPDKIIVAPKQWYKHSAFKQQSEDIALSSWIRI